MNTFSQRCGCVFAALNKLQTLGIMEQAKLILKNPVAVSLLSFRSAPSFLWALLLCLSSNFALFLLCSELNLSANQFRGQNDWSFRVQQRNSLVNLFQQSVSTLQELFDRLKFTHRWDNSHVLNSKIVEKTHFFFDFVNLLNFGESLAKNQKKSQQELSEKRRRNSVVQRYRARNARKSYKDKGVNLLTVVLELVSHAEDRETMPSFVEITCSCDIRVSSDESLNLVITAVAANRYRNSCTLLSKKHKPSHCCA